MKGYVDPTPREQFITDIIQFIHDIHKDPMDMVLLMMDANEQLGRTKKGIINLIEKAGLVDLFTLHHASEKTFELFFGSLFPFK